MKVKWHRLVFRSAETGKKIAVVRLTSKELQLLKSTAQDARMPLDQFIARAIRVAAEK
jgi:predicted DNA binding CopG/RHH family protein